MEVGATVYTKIRGEGRIALRELQADPVLSEFKATVYTKIHRGGSYSSSRASDLTHRQTLKRISTRILTIKRGDELCRRRSGGIAELLDVVCVIVTPGVINDKLPDFNCPIRDDELPDLQ